MIRGHQIGYRTTPNTYDAWDYDQYFRYYLDMMAFGTNTCEHNGTKPSKNFRNALMKYEQYEFLAEASRLADAIDLGVSLWHANDDNETEEESLLARRELYSSMPRLDYLFVPGGDPGEMEASAFVDRCKKISRLLKEIHPESQFHPSAQAPHTYPDWGKVFTDCIKNEPDEIDMVINMEPWDSEKIYDRMGVDGETMELLGITVPSLTIPVKLGRNLAVIVEVAAMNNRQKRMGYNAAVELNNRLMRHMEEQLKG